MNRPDIPGLVGARICHDLISPIGAIGNGVELLGLTGAAQGPEMQLISDSAAGAQARVQLFRIAFGRSEAGQQIRADEVRGVLRGAEDGSKVRHDWRIETPAPRTEVRCAFLAILCLQTALPRGGTIVVTRTADTWRIAGAGSVVRLEEGLAELVLGAPPPATLAPAHVQFALLPEAAAALDRSPVLRETAAGIEIGF